MKKLSLGFPAKYWFCIGFSAGKLFGDYCFKQLSLEHFKIGLAKTESIMG